MREGERSLKLLQTDHLDLMLHHNMSPRDVDRILAADEFTRYALSLPIATAVVGMDSQATLDAPAAAVTLAM